MASPADRTRRRGLIRPACTSLSLLRCGHPPRERITQTAEERTRVASPTGRPLVRGPSRSRPAPAYRSNRKASRSSGAAGCRRRERTGEGLPRRRRDREPNPLRTGDDEPAVELAHSVVERRRPARLEADSTIKLTDSVRAVVAELTRVIDQSDTGPLRRREAERDPRACGEGHAHVIRAMSITDAGRQRLARVVITQSRES